MSFFSRPFWWEPLITIGLLVGVAFIILRTYRDCRTILASIPFHVRAGVLIATVVAFVLRRFAVAPAFIHDGFIGPGIAANALQFPPDPLAPWHYGREYGLAGFTVLSLCAAIFGRTMETVLAANTFFSALTTIPLAIVAGLWARSAPAALYAAAIWATSGFVARLAHSEDIHILGMLWAMTAIALLEVALARRSVLPLMGTVLALELAVLTRQTFYPWIAIAASILVERRLRAGEHGLELGPSRGKVWALVACACVPLWLRMHYAVNSWEFADVFTVYRVMWDTPRLLGSILMDHPILALHAVSFTVPLLGLVGVIVLASRSLSPLTIVTAVIGWFVVLFPVYPNLGSDWPFRFHFYTMAIIAAGAGTAWLAQALPSVRLVGPARESGVALAVALLGLCVTRTVENRRPNAEFVEYQFMRDELARLERPFTVVGSGATGVQSRIMDLWAYDAGVPVVTPIDSPDTLAEKPRPFIFLDGLGCRTYNIVDLLMIGKTAAGERPSEELMARFHRLARDRSQHFGMDAGPIPTEIRPTCATVLAHATSIAEGPEIELVDEPPWSIFIVDRLRPRLMRWDPPAVH